jgi:protein gp37
MAYRLSHIPAMAADYAGLTKRLENGRIVWTGVVKEIPGRLFELRQRTVPTVYFVDSMSDLFHRDVSWNYLYKVFETFLLTPQHTYQVLTKRAERLHELESIYFQLKRNYPEAILPLRNVILGVSVENQKEADRRIPELLKAPAAWRFLSCEPLLGPVDLHLAGTLPKELTGGAYRSVASRLDWVIAGGESGQDARPMHPAWARSLRDQCADSDVAFLFKQWGQWEPVDQPWQQNSPAALAKGEQWLNLAGGQGFHGEEVWRMRKVGKKASGRVLDGKLHHQFPEPLKNAAI